MKTLKDYIVAIRGKMIKEGLTIYKLSQVLGVDERTLKNLFYHLPNEKGKLITFIKLLNYLEGGVRNDG